MLRCATVLALLVLTWTEQAGSTMCGDKCNSKEHQELYSILDKTEAAVSKILTSEKDKNILSDVSKKMKSKICDLDLDPEELSRLITKWEKKLKKIEDGTIKEEQIIQFLNNDPMKHMEACIEKMRKKK